MKHRPDDNIRPRTTVLSSTRWGLRTGLTGWDRRRLADNHPYYTTRAPYRKVRHGSRGVTDHLRDVDIPRDQIGALWLADNDPEYELVTHTVPDEVLSAGLGQAVAKTTTSFEPIDFDPCELYLNMDASYDNNFAEDGENLDGEPYELDDPNRTRSPKVWFDIERPHTRLHLLLRNSFGRKTLGKRIGLLRILADQILNVPGVDQAVRPLLIEMALTTVTIDGETILQHEDQAQDLSSTQSLSTLEILILIANAFVGESIWNKMIWEKHEKKRRRNRAPSKPKKATKGKNQPKAEKGAVKKPQKTKKPPKKKGPNVWGILTRFLKDCLDHVRPLVRKHEVTAIRTAQFVELEHWVTSRSNNEREQFLCRWRIQVIRLACELLDAGRADEHKNRGFVVALSFVGTPKGQRAADAFDADDIQRFLEGHPDASADDLLSEFNDGWKVANQGRVRARTTLPDPVSDLLGRGHPRRRRKVKQSPEQARDALLAEMMKP